MPEDELVTNVDDPRLLDAIDRNVAEMSAGVAASVGGEVYRGPDLIRYVTDIPDVIVNGIHAARFAEDSLDTAIERALAPFKERGLPTSWLVNPASSRPLNLGERLAALGLQPQSGRQGFAANINEVGQPVALPGVTIERVKNDADAEAWTQIFASGMRIAPESVGVMQYIVKRALTRNDPLQAYYLAFLDGAPVGVGALYLRAGVAGVHSVTTLESARNRGIATELVRQAALDARQAGYQVAVAHFRPMGSELPAPLGFKLAAQYTAYLWTPPE